MKQISQEMHKLTPLQRAVLVAERLETRLNQLESAACEPIAIIGLGCRFPGQVHSPAAFWELLREGKDGITEVPGDRWNIESYYDPDPETPGKIYSRSGGFVDPLQEFDADFFGISHREARSLDPQQRLLMEVGWETLEHAGIDPRQLKGTQTGVFMGVCSNDYSTHLINHIQAEIDAYFGTGTAHSVVAGRLSYWLGLVGPSLVINTACSSSLVTVHLACQSLRNRECNLALAGGVNLIFSPEATLTFSQARMLSKDGRCKTFDVSANGYVRSEGCGIIALKRLSDALADQDRILSLVSGSAINQDGQSSGLTVPNGLAQQAVINQALKNASVSPCQVNYIEAHGTGTSLGDPIEMRALGEVFGANHSSDNPLIVGSVKTNIGHLEGAAGIAGIIKVVLQLQNQEIAPHLHFDQPSPYIDWEQLPIKVPTSRLSWSRGQQPRIAGVSSFGFSGTNAHVILQEPPIVPTLPKTMVDRPAHILTLSAKTRGALEASVSRYLEHLAIHPDLNLEDICFTASVGRAHFNHRLAVVSASTSELREKLDGFFRGEMLPGVYHKEQSHVGAPPRIAFMFTGQGSQYIHMGRQLYETQPLFRKIIKICDEILQAETSQSLLQILYPDAGTNSPIHETAYSQPSLFALEYALAELWKSWGVVPDVVMGHSLGEYVAACIAGVFSLEDGLRLVSNRGRLMQSLPHGGGMLAVRTSRLILEPLLESYDSVSIAAVNGPESAVISGELSSLQTIEANLTSRGVKTQWLQVSHAFHSPLMEPMLSDFTEIASNVSYAKPEIPIVSNVTGRIADDAIANAAYWVDHVRQPVQFADGIACLKAQECEIFLEIGPRPILAGMGRQCLPEGTGVWLPSLRPEADWASMLGSLAQLYVAGEAVDWQGFDEGYARNKVVLPRYPFQRQRFWIESQDNGYQKVNNSSSSDKSKSETTLTRLLQQGKVTEMVDYLLASGDLIDSQKTQITEFVQLLIRKNQHELGEKCNVVFDYYNSLSDVGSDLDQEKYLTFAPFPEIKPGFSWLLTFAEPQKNLAEAKIVLETQKEMREVLFGSVDFSHCQKVLDFGCGYGSDLIALAEQYPNLELCGYTISSGQARVANEKIREGNLAERVCVYNRDSAKNEFPEQYDVAIGFEVVHHIKNKPSLFANLGKHLNEAGFLVVADFISNAAFPIEHDETSSYFITKEVWVEQLSINQLKVIDCIDVSQQIANFLYDPNFESNLERLYQLKPDKNIREAFQSYDRLGGLLRNGLASYVLLTAQKDSQLSVESLRSLNKYQLDSLVSYSERSLKQWIYKTVWKPQPLESDLLDVVVAQENRSNLAKSNNNLGFWLIFADQQGIGQMLAEQLLAQGYPCQLIFLDKSPELATKLEYDALSVSVWDADLQSVDWDEQLKTVFQSFATPCQGIIHLWSMETTLSRDMASSTWVDGQLKICGSVLYLIQALSRLGVSELSKLLLVTQNSQAVDLSSETLQVQQNTLWGLGRTIIREHPSLHCTCFDIGQETVVQDTINAIYRELFAGDREDQVVYYQGTRHVSRLVRSSSSNSIAHQLPTISEDATYLITGGLGAIGLNVSGWLIEKGARHLVLVSRSQLSEVDQGKIDQLESLGAQVSVCQANVCNQSEIARILEQIGSSSFPLKGIIHAAGVLDDGILLQQTWERFIRVMEPKIIGTWNLHELTQNQPLDFFVCFSSLAAVMGSPGQSNYVAANAFMDALVNYRSALQLPGLSINWGLWSTKGMAANLNSQHQNQLAAQGLGKITPAQGLQALEDLLFQDVTQVAVFPVNWSRFFNQFPPGMLPPLLLDLVDQQQSKGGKPVLERQIELLSQLQNASANDRLNFLINYLKSRIARVLGRSSSLQLASDLSLNELGLDSLMAIELKNCISVELDVDIQMQKLIEGISIEELASTLSEQLLVTNLTQNEILPLNNLNENIEEVTI